MKKRSSIISSYGTAVLKKLKTKIPILLLFFIFSLSFNAQSQSCNSLSSYSIKVVGNTLVFSADMPDIPGAYYAFGYDNGSMTHEEDGPVMVVDLSVFSSSTPTWVRLLVATSTSQQMCNEAVYVSYGACEPAGFTYDAMGCLVAFSFDSNPTVISQTWSFGDGSDEVFANSKFVFPANMH